ncbi:MAG: hypothetical protein ABIH35_02715 [Patescibacteria group bacterium]
MAEVTQEGSELCEEEARIAEIKNTEAYRAAVGAGIAEYILDLAIGIHVLAPNSSSTWNMDMRSVITGITHGKHSKAFAQPLNSLEQENPKLADELKGYSPQQLRVLASFLTSLLPKPKEEEEEPKKKFLSKEWIKDMRKRWSEFFG